jgi:hypothetical protein
MIPSAWSHPIVLKLKKSAEVIIGAMQSYLELIGIDAIPVMFVFMFCCTWQSSYEGSIPKWQPRRRTPKRIRHAGKYRGVRHGERGNSVGH